MLLRNIEIFLLAHELPPYEWLEILSGRFLTSAETDHQLRFRNYLAS